MKLFTVAKDHIITGATFRTTWIQGECFIGTLEFGKVAVSNELLLNRDDALLSPSLDSRNIHPLLTIMRASVAVSSDPRRHKVLVPQTSESCDALIWIPSTYRFKSENELMPGLMVLPKGQDQTVEILDLGYFHGYRPVGSYRLYYNGLQVYLNDWPMDNPWIWP